MKIANIELFTPQEDYSYVPNSYGAGSCFAREAKLAWLGKIDFHLFGFESNFSEYKKKDKSPTFVLDDWAIKAIKEGKLITDIIPDMAQYDIIIHNHIGFAINTGKIKQVFWSPFGKSEDAHPDIKYRLNYRESKIYPEGTKNYPVIIAPHINEFYEPSEKEDFVFQCTRLDEQTNAIEVIKQCNKLGIRGYFAGPIFFNMNKEHYPLEKYIDNKNTFYLGVISQEKKLEMYGKARMAPFLFKRNPSFNMSVIEALNYGTPILVPEEDLQERGASNCMEETNRYDKQFLKKMNTGLFYNGKNFEECWEQSSKISSLDCWIKSQEFTHTKMLESFKKALYQIYYDKTN